MITVGTVGIWLIGGAVSAFGGWLFHKATRTKTLQAKDAALRVRLGA
jgi:hypothetical protein